MRNSVPERAAALPRCGAGRRRRDAGHRHLAAHEVGEHLADRQAQARAAARRSARFRAPRERLEHVLELAGGDAGPGVLDLEHGHLAHMGEPELDAAHVRELDGVAEHVDEDLTQSLLVGTDELRQRLGERAAKLDALGRRLQLEHANDLLDAVAKAHRLGLDAELAGLDPSDVERALDEREQVLATAPDDADGLVAVRRHRGVVLEQLRIAEDAVERRAQLVAHGRDVAALGLVGELGAALGALQLLVGAAVRFDLALQDLRLLVERLGLPVRLFLGHLPALVRQHQPPGDDAAHQEQRGEGLDEAEAQGDRRRVAGFEQQGQLLRVEHREQATEQGHDHRHQQQVVAEAGLDVGPGAPRQERSQQAVPLHRETCMRLAEIVAARIERAAERADGAAVGGTMGEVVALVVRARR